MRCAWLAAYLSGTTTLTPEVDINGDTARIGADGCTPFAMRPELRVNRESIATGATVISSWQK